jgi:hypothetical protein
MQAGQVVAFDCGDPRGQALVVAAGHHLGEGGDVPAVAFSCGLRALIFASLAVSSAVRCPGWLMIHQVTFPDGRRGKRKRRSGKRGAQRLPVAPHRPLAALVALRGDLGVQQGGAGAAPVPAPLQVGGEMVLAAGARARAYDHLAGGGGAGELADGVPRQAQHLGDLGVVLALREQVMDRGVAFPAADRQAALDTVRARSLGGHVGGDAAAWPAGLPIAGFRGGIR